jgi:hypothetical protein
VASSDVEKLHDKLARKRWETVWYQRVCVTRSSAC